MFSFIIIIIIIIIIISAEAQCAELCKSGAVFATVTEDMDALTLGTPVLLRRLALSGGCGRGERNGEGGRGKGEGEGRGGEGRGGVNAME